MTRALLSAHGIMSCICIDLLGSGYSVGGVVAIANVHLVQLTSCFKMLRLL